jgi:muramidase (phage lysozyme)
VVGGAGVNVPNSSRIAQVGADATTGDAGSTTLDAVFEAIAGGELARAREEAHAVAEAARAAGDAETPRYAGLVWQTSDALTRARAGLERQAWRQVKDESHRAAERARELSAAKQVNPATADRVIQAAGGYWTKASNAEKQAETTRSGTPGALEGKAETAPRAVWTTGGGSSLLPQNGKWDQGDFRTHHSDRTSSYAADQVRAGRNIPYDSVDAYDFTFESLDGSGRAVEGSAQGLPLIIPVKSRVLDIQPTFQGSGGSGKFILLEYVEGDLAGERVSIHHLDTVKAYAKGQLVPGGAVFGTQGSSGERQFDYAAHVDIVGTAPAVERFVRANQSGKFETTETSPQVAADTGQARPAAPGAAPASSPAATAKPTAWQDAPALSEVAAGRALLRQGHRGDAVASAQRLLGVAADGDFGAATFAAVKTFQARNGLKPAAGQEGSIGKTTLEVLQRSVSTGAAIGPAGAMGIAPLAISGTDDVEKYPATLRAFLRAITYAEGTPDAAGYRREVGGTMYPATQRVHPGAENTSRYQETGFNSDAYGRYQFLSDTWASWAGQANIPTAKSGKNRYGEAYYDTAPQFQDKAALEFLVRSGVHAELQAGRVHGAVAKVNQTWASLPGGPQPNDKTGSFYSVYDSMLREERAADEQRARS